MGKQTRCRNDSEKKEQEHVGKNLCCQPWWLAAINHHRKEYWKGMLSSIFVCAAAAPSGAESLKNLLLLMNALIAAIAAITLLVGLVRLVISHSQEDPSESQKAAMFIATSIALFMLRALIYSPAVEKLLNTINSYGHG